MLVHKTTVSPYVLYSANLPWVCCFQEVHFALILQKLTAVDPGLFRNPSHVAPAPGGVLKLPGLSSASIRAWETFHTS